MREIVLDTETTGLRFDEGHRLVEIGAVEIVNLVPTGKTYHVYINPERDMPEGAYNVHGLSEAFLREYPVFKDQVQGFLDFIAEDPLVIHNAPFDMGFLNGELGVLGLPLIPLTRVVDTLVMARTRFPGSPASLDALCKRFSVDATSRTKHGALIDSELLAEVYLNLKGGRQQSFLGGGKASQGAQSASASTTQAASFERPKREPRTFSLTPEEEKAHQSMVENLGDKVLWKKA